MVEVTDVYGVTRNYSSDDARDKARQTERDKALLEAAQSGDFSAVTANVNPRDRRDVINQANAILKKYNALEGANTGDYSGASADTPKLYIGGGQTANSYNRVFNEGRGYAVYDSVTEADGTQYLAVSGKNSSFIEKINPDGTRERVDSVSRINSTPDAFGNVTKTGTRGKNVRRVLDAFSNLKTGLANTTTTTSTTSTTTDTDDDTTDTNLTDTSLTDGPSPGGGTSLQDTAFVDRTVDRPEIVEITPSTEVVQLKPGEVAPIDPSTPKTVVQQVAPVTQTQPTQASPFVMPGSVPQTGTVATPVQTAGLSAVPGQVTYKTSYAGTAGAVPQTILTSTPGSGEQIASGYQQVPYINPQTNQVIIVTEFNGKPITYIPPGFVRQASMTEQQTVEQPTASDNMGMSLGGDVTLARKFLGFPEDAPDNQLDNFLQSSPAAAARMGKYRQAMMNMGGMRMGAQEGTTVTTAPPAPVINNPLAQQSANLVGQTMQPIQAPIAGIQPTAEEFIPVDAGMTTPMAPFAEAATTGAVTQAEMPTPTDITTADFTTVSPQVQSETDKLAAEQGEVSDIINAAQQETTSVSGLEAALGDFIKVDAPDAREIQEGEIISGVADATKASKFTEAIQAAEATPSKQATVAGQLEGLMNQFEGGNTPPWAAGSMRQAMATMAARGLGASSMAGQAIIQATMEAALPIAQMDAQTQAQFESQNLSNRQQRAMLAAQQRAQFIGQEFDQAFQARVQNAAKIADVANMNFTAEQQIALEDARAANTVNLNNLSNRQAMVMAEAAALAQLDMANLSNRQQAAVQNAANFLQMDMANLSNRQQTEVFKAQQNIQALFTDQAAENAAEQFNAANKNQTDQFFANLAGQTSQFNAVQANAMDQFNVNSVNALREFNSQIQQQRDLFNAQNGLVIAQANAQWRQNLATLNTAAQNESNMAFAQTINALTSTNLDAIWQRERDILSMAFQVSESNADRANSIILQKMAADAEIDVAELMAKIGAKEQTGNLIGELALKAFSGLNLSN